MNNYIKKLIEGNHLTYEETEDAMNTIMEGKATEAQIGSLLTALRMRGETVEEITASAKVMREKCNQLKGKGDLLDIVGTGGDCTNTFNVSTVSSLVVAAAGVKVAKHGNRSVSSKCGSADVLEALGVKLDITKEQNEKVLEEVGICFMFAPLYHSAMKYVAGPRRQMGVRTIFNILGPLASPAYANLQVLGVYSEDLVIPMAQVLANLGIKHAMVVHGQDGVDEVSLCAPTTVCEVREKELRSFVLNPQDLGLTLCKQSDLVGGEAALNKQIALQILSGEKGPKRDMVLLNSAVALTTALDNISMQEAIKLSAELIDSGKAMKKLNDFIESTNSFGQVAI
nr:anthranilate phosphoribosyltransferase [uncultured Cellulosilyticum sp.]